MAPYFLALRAVTQKKLSFFLDRQASTSRHFNQEKAAFWICIFVCIVKIESSITSFFCMSCYNLALDLHLKVKFSEHYLGSKLVSNYRYWFSFMVLGIVFKF
jgi:hypothetical protein